MDFLWTLNLFASLGVTGAKQQSILWVLWKKGPMSWSQIKEQISLGNHTITNFQTQALLAKGLIEAEKGMVSRKKTTTYRIRKEVLDYLNTADS